MRHNGQSSSGRGNRSWRNDRGRASGRGQSLGQSQSNGSGVGAGAAGDRSVCNWAGGGLVGGGDSHDRGSRGRGRSSLSGRSRNDRRAGGDGGQSQGLGLSNRHGVGARAIGDGRVGDWNIVNKSFSGSVPRWELTWASRCREGGGLGGQDSGRHSHSRSGSRSLGLGALRTLSDHGGDFDGASLSDRSGVGGRTTSNSGVGDYLQR